MRRGWSVRAYTLALVVIAGLPALATTVFLLASGREEEIPALPWFVAALILALGGAAWLCERMLRPVREISSVVRRVAAGDRSVRAKPSGPNEIAEISRRLNQMLDGLAQSEQALQSREARYRALYENSNDAIVCVDSDGCIVFANDATERVLGFAPGDLIGKDASLMQPPRLRANFRRGLERFLEAGTAPRGRTTVETQVLHRRGHEVAVEFTYSLLQLQGADHVVGILRDITERRVATARHRESEARFRAMADSAPAFIWMTDVEQRCVYVNRTWLAYTGRSLLQEQGEGWLQSVHPDDRDAARAASTQALQARRRFAVETRLRRHDGEYRWVFNQGVPRYDGSGAFAGYIGTAVEIHERVAAEHRVHRLTMLYAALSQANEALLQSRDPQELFERVCANIVHHGMRAAAVALLDHDGRFLRVVATAGDTWNALHGVVIATDGSDRRDRIPAMLALRARAPFVCNDRANDPRTIPIAEPAAAQELEASASFPLRRQGAVIGVLDVFSDEVNVFDAEMARLLELLADAVSFALDTLAAQANRDRAEASLRQLNATLEARVAERTYSLEAANRELEAANRELEAFSYSVSHDLRAPLRGIAGFADLVLEKSGAGLDAESAAYLGRVKAAAARMSKLINDLLDLSRITRAAFHLRRTSLTAMAEEIVAELRAGDPARDVEVRIATDAVAQADPGLVRVLLANLLGNAWKFTSRREHAAIELGVTDRDGIVAFFVRDNGAGFDMEHASHLFSPFQRLHSEREFPGTGIGLALAQRVVRRHGGFIWGEGTVGVGATFFFTLQP